jgi:hypothetical protein
MDVDFGVADRTFLDSFQRCTLSKEHWTHRAHVRIAYLHLVQFRFDEALDRMRAGIQALNAAHGTAEGPTSGYNETTTHAFLHLVAAVMQAYETTHPVKDSNQFCDVHPELMSRHVLRFFYSPERRMHPEAKTRFVEPDLAPLPKRDGGKG